jgi:hypothetical protein
MRVELGFEFKPTAHEVHSVLPDWEYHIPGKDLHIVEKGLATSEPLTQQGIFGIAPLQHRMAQKGS